MDFVDEQHVALFEIRQQGREIAGLGDHRPDVARKPTPSSRATICASVVCRGRGPTNSHMVQRLAALAGGLDEDREIGARLRPADEFRQQLRAQRECRRDTCCGARG